MEVLHFALRSVTDPRSFRNLVSRRNMHFLLT